MKIKLNLKYLIFVILFVIFAVVKVKASCTAESPNYCEAASWCDTGNCVANCCSDKPPTVDPNWTCFAAGTKVSMSDPTSPTASLGAGQKNIEDVVVGDKVISQDEMGKKSVSTVTKLDQPIREHMCRVEFVAGHELKMTTEHPIMTSEGWKSITPSKTAEENPTLIVQSLEVGDKVVKEDGTKGEIESISCWSEKTPAYNLILDGTARTYFADGYLAHNKGGTAAVPGTCPAGQTKVCPQVRPVTDPAAIRICGDAFTANGWNADGTPNWYYYNCHTDCESRCTNPANWITTCDNWTQCYYCDCVQTCTPAAPTAPGLDSPPPDASIASPDVTLAWSDPSSWGTACTGTGNSFTVWMRDNVDTTWRNAASNLTTNTYGFTGGIVGRTYEWGVAAYNADGLDGWSGSRFFTIVENKIIGTVFNDVDNNCGGTGWSAGGVSVSLDGGAGVAVDSLGQFTLTAAPLGSHTLAVSIPAGYMCSTTCGMEQCPTKSGVTTSLASNDFHLTASRGAWWQAEGAGVYVGGGQLRSILPSASSRLILAPAGQTAAALLMNGGNPELGSLGSLSDPLWLAKTKYKGKTMGYDYFAAHMGVVKGQSSDWTLSDEIVMADYPSGKDFGYKAGFGTVANNIDVSATQSYVVFVNGDLQINADITVANGGFLTFIVNGNVTVAPGVTTTQGLYVMDGNFVTEADSTQLDVQGSVVVWGEFSLGRDLGTSNATIPAEKFTYRADLIANMPDKMKVFALQWQEVVAGTFGN